AEWRNAVQQPRQLAVRGNMRLHEDGRDLRVDPAGEVQRSDLAGLGAQFYRVMRDGNRVQVHDAEIAAEVVLLARPLLERAEIIPDGQVARRLNARENTLGA